MLESLIVYLIILTLLFLILAIFSVLFQRWNIQIIANETAMRVAQTYRVTTSDTMDGYMSEDKLSESWDRLALFRYPFSTSMMNNQADSHAKEYAADRLSRTTYTHDVTAPQISVEVQKDCLPRRHVNVTIKGEYAVPFGAMLGYFGFDSTTKYEVTSSAECLDLMEYMHLTDYETAMLKGSFIQTDIIKKTVNCVDAFLSLVHNIKETFFEYETTPTEG